MSIVKYKSKLVEEYIKGEIISGGFPEGFKLTERYLASRLEVSQTTLRIGLKVLAEQGYLERSQRSGTYVKNFKEAGKILIVANLDALATPCCYGYRMLVEEAKDKVVESGYKALLTVGHGRTSEEFVDSLDCFNGCNLSSILGVYTAESNPQLNKVFQQNNLKVTTVCTEPVEGVKNAVMLNIEQALVEGIQRLKQAGYDEFAFMYVGTRYREFGGMRNRNYYRELFEKHQVKMPENWLKEVDWSWDRRGAYRAIKEMMLVPRPPKAIFFGEDCICDVSLRAISDLRIKIPEDLSVITLSNICTRFLFPYDLTRVEFNPGLATDIAWKMLSKLIEGEDIESPFVSLNAEFHPGETLQPGSGRR